MDSNQSNVRFIFYNFKPRMRVDFVIHMNTVPIVGDFIEVAPKYINEVSTKLIDRERVKMFGKVFVVVKRTYNTKPHPFSKRLRKIDWYIELDVVEPLEDII